MPPPTPPAPPSASPAAPETTTGPVIVANPAKLGYDVQAQTRGMTYNASAELTWSHDGVSYDAKLVISAFLIGSRNQTSTGRIGTQGLEPQRFGDRTRREQAAHFDRERQRITFSANTAEAPLLPGAQDRLSLVLQLGALLAGDPARQQRGSSLTVQSVGPRDAALWLFTVEGEETVELAGQSFPSIKLLRLPRSTYDTRLELWLARNLSYLPVRIRVSHGNGDFVDQQLQSIDTPAAR